MPAKPDLPTELNEVEAMLKRFAPVGSTVNRDTLMYQAGWTAAKTQSRGNAPWLWPTTSAALAAALLLSITLPHPPASPLQRAGTEQSNARHSTALKNPPRVEVLTEPELVRAAPVPLKRYSPNAPLLRMRERALRNEFDEVRSTMSAGAQPAATSSSRRELLREFLPADTSRKSPNPWWIKLSFGETS